MKLNVGDYISDTRHLTTFQHGCYILLILHCFKRGCLPRSKRAILRVAGLQPGGNQWKAVKPVLDLFRQVDGVLRHKRVDKELEETTDGRVDITQTDDNGACSGYTANKVAERVSQTRSDPVQPVEIAPRARRRASKASKKKSSPLTPQPNGGGVPDSSGSHAAEPTDSGPSYPPASGQGVLDALTRKPVKPAYLEGEQLARFRANGLKKP